MNEKQFKILVQMLEALRLAILASANQNWSQDVARYSRASDDEAQIAANSLSEE